MKKFLSLLTIAAMLAFAPAALAIDPHDTKVTNVTNYDTVTTSAAQTVTIATATTTAVNAGTNSYVIRAVFQYDVPSGNAVTFQLANAGTAIASTVTKLANTGLAVIETEVEGIAASVAITLTATAVGSGTPIKVQKATLMLMGLAGATQ